MTVTDETAPVAVARRMLIDGRLTEGTRTFASVNPAGRPIRPCGSAASTSCTKRCATTSRPPRPCSSTSPPRT